MVIIQMGSDIIRNVGIKDILEDFAYTLASDLQI